MWRYGSKKGLLCGRDNICQKVEDKRYVRALYLVCLYTLSLFVILKRAAARLEKIQRDFLWGGGELEKKFHSVNWSIVCLEKHNGGLGFKSLHLFNKVVLGK